MADLVNTNQTFNADFGEVYEVEKPGGGTVTDEQIREAVDDYMAENPINVDVSNLIPAPSVAEVGQTIRVSAVDADGRPTAWEAVDMASGGGGDADEYVVIFNKTLEAAVGNTDQWGGESHMYGDRHFWTTDIDGNAIDADGIYFRIFVPAQSEVTSGELQMRVGEVTPARLAAWDDQCYIGYASFVGAAQHWAFWDYDLRRKELTSGEVRSQTERGNFQGSTIRRAVAFEKNCAENNWTHWIGVKIHLVSGSLPAGTQLFCYARKRNPAKLTKPDWGVI